VFEHTDPIRKSYWGCYCVPTLCLGSLSHTNTHTHTHTPTHTPFGV